MLNKKIFGRLGNQMFQYAAVRAYQEKYAKQEKINLDFSDTFQYLERGNRLELLNFNIQECKFSKVKTTLPQKIILKYLYIRKIGCFIMSKINPKKNGANTLRIFKIKFNTPHSLAIIVTIRIIAIIMAV